MPCDRCGKGTGSRVANIHFPARCGPGVSHRSETGCMIGNRLCPLSSKPFLSCFPLKMTKEHGHLVFIVLKRGWGKGLAEIKRKKESTKCTVFQSQGKKAPLELEQKYVQRLSDEAVLALAGFTAGGRIFFIFLSQVACVKQCERSQSVTRQGQNNPALIIIIKKKKKYGLRLLMQEREKKKKKGDGRTRKIVWADCQRLNLSQRG